MTTKTGLAIAGVVIVAFVAWHYLSIYGLLLGAGIAMLFLG